MLFHTLNILFETIIMIRLEEVLEFSLLLYFVLGVGGILVYLYIMYPVIYIHIYFRIAVLMSGMKLNYVEVDGLKICYGEKGKKKPGQPSMLLLHGFTADKFMWVPLVKNMSKDTHILAVDLPGHGYSDTPGDHEEISHHVTVDKMKKLLSQTGYDREPFHLVGMSMGGALAGIYAAQHPHDVHALTLMCPAMKTPTESPFWQKMMSAIENSVDSMHQECNLLFPTTASQVQEMLNYVQYHKIRVPKQILQGVLDWRKSYYPFYARLFRMFADPDLHDLLQKQLHLIQAPTQVVWGEHDQVIDSSGVGVLKGLLPNCVQVDLIPRCGHSMCMDRPGAITKAVNTFRQKTCVGTS